MKKSSQNTETFSADSEILHELKTTQLHTKNPTTTSQHN